MVKGWFIDSPGVKNNCDDDNPCQNLYNLPMTQLDSLKPILQTLAEGKSLSQEEAYAAVHFLMSGNASQIQAAALLMGLRTKGETVDELTGAVQAMRAHMVRIQAPANAMDIVGTGGDNSGTYNISTAAAFVLSAGGIPVAKHGNRAFSSRSGAADVLQALGVDITIPVERMAEAINTIGIGFLFAPNHHPAIRHVQPIRVELGVRTLFNLLGPMCNPAGVKRQVTGVYDAKWLEPMARTLGNSGTEYAWLVHSKDGLDELSPTADTLIVEWKRGAITHHTITPESVGLNRCTLEDIKGGDAAFNAAAMREVFAGKPSHYADSVALNAAAGFVVAERLSTLQDGVALAQQILRDGKALEKVEALAGFTKNSRNFTEF